ncbi:winged helix-turn-helix domain-containing protein [Tahibacter sp.]|uniref:winged helix-turn-helix domain-containing protein n=1 Tax=Tahibacter sp. TaxID=2056211 RepID=UPI0028C4B281|nr:winged helix-turn-helix domain-containing protein [Tahibacter sp.]
MADVKTLPWPADTRLVRLGEIEIDPRYRCVSRAGVAYELNPRCFDLLLLFLSEPRVLHTRDAIFRKVWRGAVVEDANLTTSIWLLRRALGGAAKQWIRTVSKQGYIFDPPPTLEFELVSADEPTSVASPEIGALVIDAATRADVVNDAAPLEVSAPAVAARSASTIPRGWALTLATAAACLSLMLLTGGLLGARSRGTAPTHVVLVATTDPSLPENLRWPARLLQHWLSWQLSSVPHVILRTPSESVADGNETIVLLEVGAPAQGTEWRVSAHFRGSAPQAAIVRRADSAHLVSAIAAVSADVFARLAATDSNHAPTLNLDAATAQQLAEGLEAEQQHRWGDAVRAYTTVLTAVPAMGFARFRLARCLTRLGQQGAAQAELSRTTGWIDGLPAFLREPVQAEAFVIRQDYTAAADAYAALQKNVADGTGYRPAEAASLRRAGRSREAAERIGEALPPVPAQAIDWLIERAETEIANRDFRAAAASAAQARELAHTMGWEHERALAALALAEARSASGDTKIGDLLREAEQGFAAIGDRLGVLGARMRAELERGAPAVPESTLNQLLAEARTAGNSAAEIDALRRVALAHYRDGDTREAHRRFAQAAAIAESAGNAIERRRIDLHLLQQDTLRLDFAALEKRLTLLDGEPQQGGMVYAVGLNRARLQYLRGDLDGALLTVESTESRLRETPSGNLPQSTAPLNCIRATVRLLQGRTADARSEFRSCRTAGNPALNHFADLGDAELAIQAGDVAEARRLLAPLLTPAQDTQVEPDRWGLAMEVAPLLARVGDFETASTIIDRTLPLIRDSGYRMIEANLRITRAEIALAEGKADDAEREIALIENMLPPDYWYERRRTRTVRALIAQARGEIELAAQGLEALHTDTRVHGDVLGELLVHSLMDANTAVPRCPDERRLHLLAASGMRGASDLWMNPAGRDRAHLVSASQGANWATP